MRTSASSHAVLRNTSTPVDVTPTRPSDEGSRESWLIMRYRFRISRPSILSSSGGVLIRCVPVAMRIVTSSGRTCGISSKSARSMSRRGCARVMSQTEMATRWPARTSSPSRGRSRGARIALSSVACESETAGLGIGSMTVTRSSGRSTSRPSVP